MKNVESYLVINQVKHYTIYKVPPYLYSMFRYGNKLELYKNSHGYYMI